MYASAPNPELTYGPHNMTQRDDGTQDSPGYSVGFRPNNGTYLEMRQHVAFPFDLSRVPESGAQGPFATCAASIARGFTPLEPCMTVPNFIPSNHRKEEEERQRKYEEDFRRRLGLQALKQDTLLPGPGS